MVTLPPKLSKGTYARPTYEEFREAATEERGVPPIGLEMLEYVRRHPEQERIIFPNPARMRA